MKLFIIIIMTIFVPLQTFAKTSGSLYFPVVWEIQTTAEAGSGQFSSGTMIFKNTSTGTAVSVPFAQSDLLDLSSENLANAWAFFGEKKFELPSGHYDKISLSTKYFNRVDILYDYPIQFDIVDNKLTVLSGILARSRLDAQTEKTNSKPAVLINRASIDYADILKLLPASSIKNAINSANASSPFITQPLSSQQSATHARYGFVFEFPCGFQGVATITFALKNDPVAYSKQISISPQYCHANPNPQSNIVNIFLPKGEWRIVQISQVHDRATSSLGFAAIDHPKLLQYYNTSSEKFVRNNAYSKNISKPFTISVNTQSFSRSFFYAGIFAMKINPETNDFSSLTFQRNFSLRGLRKIFGERQAFNAYSGQRMMHDSILGSVGVLLNNVNVTQGFDPQITQIGNASVDIISACLKAADLQNPLMNVNGKIVLNNQTGNFSVTENNIQFSENSQGVTNISNCIVKGFLPANLPKSKEQFVLEAQVYSL